MDKMEVFEVTVAGYNLGVKSGAGVGKGNTGLGFSTGTPYYVLKTSLWSADGHHTEAELHEPDLRKYIAQLLMEGWQLVSVNSAPSDAAVPLTSYYFTRPAMVPLDEGKLIGKLADPVK